MELPFETYDVFTETRYRGNPLAVVTIPAGGPKPSQEQKQAIACEFNLSETIFIHGVSDPATNKQRQIDIFLPFREIPFAGHPTIGGAVSLLSQGVDTVITKAGPIAVKATGPISAQAAIPHNINLHAKRLRDITLQTEDLHTDVTIRQAELDAPLFSIVKGMTFALTELPSIEVLGQAKHTALEPPINDLLDSDWQEGLLARYYFVRTGTRMTEDGVPVVSLRTRMLLKVFEDPATGSAACALCSYLSVAAKEQSVPKVRYEITQGVEMGKESNIVVEIGVRDSKLVSVDLSGPAVKVMQGVLSV